MNIQNENNNTERQTNIQADHLDDEINLLDLFQVILNRKKMIVGITAVAIIISVVVSLLLPEMFTATARILPPQESKSGISGLLSDAGGMLGGLAGGFLGSQTSSELYVGILESRTIADAVINKFNLKELYDMEYLADVYKKLADRTEISVSRQDQIVSVSVEDRDPQRAADMANLYIQALDHINRTVKITEGYRKRVFLETRLSQVHQDLVKAEVELKEFQEKYKLVSLDEQARVAIEGAARIKGEIISAKTELEVMKQFGTERQIEAIMLKAKIAELQNQLAKIEGSTSIKGAKGGNITVKKDSDFYIPFNELPELGMQLVRFIREAKIQEKIFELVTSQYELAKVEEAKDIDTIQVLDKAVPPDKKSSPKRSLIVILSTFLAFFFAVFMAFFLEFMDRIKTEDEERYQQLRQGLKFWK
ncbi:GumC family protein [Thermodesulfobacteriota bacterium]